MCGYKVLNSGEKPKRIFTDEEMQAVIEGIFVGDITIASLDVATYTAIAEYLTSGMFLGYGKELIGVEFGSPDFDMIFSLRENTYVFSAAKTYQQTKAISELVYDGNKRRSFYDFEKKAKAIFEDYNVNYLSAEYDLAVASGRQASNWLDIQNTKHQLPFLTYKTVGDARVRPTHQALDNIRRPVDDPFWDSYYPPNGWRCRCHVEKDEEGPVTDLTNFKKPDDVPDLFLMNCGKQKIIFNPAHPYFDVPDSDKALAMNNYNMPLPKIS